MSAAARAKADPKDRQSGTASGGGHVAAALRDAYEEAVREDVPSEFLALLGKLA